MSLREVLERRIRAEIDKWEKDIAALEAKAEKEAADAAARRELHDRIERIRDAVSGARDRLGQLRQTGEDALESISDSIEQTLARLRKNLPG